jgi:hypothetical protein
MYEIYGGAFHPKGESLLKGAVPDRVQNRLNGKQVNLNSLRVLLENTLSPPPLYCALDY